MPAQRRRPTMQERVEARAVELNAGRQQSDRVEELGEFREQQQQWNQKHDKDHGELIDRMDHFETKLDDAVIITDPEKRKALPKALEAYLRRAAFMNSWKGLVGTLIVGVSLTGGILQMLGLPGGLIGVFKWLLHL